MCDSMFVKQQFNVLLESSPTAHHVKQTAGLQCNTTFYRLTLLLALTLCDVRTGVL